MRFRICGNAFSRRRTQKLHGGKGAHAEIGNYLPMNGVFPRGVAVVTVPRDNLPNGQIATAKLITRCANAITGIIGLS